MDYSDIGLVARSAVVQIIVFSLIPFMWWLTWHRKKEPFLQWIGLKTPHAEHKMKAAIAVACYWLIWAILHMPAITQYTQLSANGFLGMGASAIIPALIVSFAQTAFWEELLFRGFLLKRIASRLTVNKAILVQAVVFGLIHNLVVSGSGLSAHLIIFISTAIGGYMLGYISEKIFGGSIIPGIMLHGIGNLLMNLSVAYGWFL